MSRRRHKKRNRPGGGGFGGTTVRAGRAADSTLRTLLVNFMALPAGSTVLVDGSVYMSEDAALYLRAMQARCNELGGDPLRDVFLSLAPHDMSGGVQ